MNRSSPLYPFQQQLQKLILQLQSNQILEQMRNDQSLAEYKRQHIRQLIQQQLKLEPLVEQLTLENNELKEKMGKVQVIFDKERQEHVQELQNIEAQWMQFKTKTDREKKELQENHVYQLQDFQKEVQKINQENSKVKAEIVRIKMENDHLREDRLKLEEHRATAENTILKLKREVAVKEKELEDKSQVLQEKTEVEKSEYEQVIAKMQQDMFLIRQTWQQKCEEIQNQLREENNMLALEYEEKMRKELKEHAESLKLGKSVVIQDSEDIISRRVQKIEQEYSDQARKFEQELENLRGIEQAAKEEIQSKEKVNRQLKSKSKELELEIEKLKTEMNYKGQSQNMVIESIKGEKSKIEKQLKQLKSQMSLLEKEKKQIKDELNSMTKKYNSLDLQNQKLRQQNSMLKQKSKHFEESSEEKMKQMNKKQHNLLEKDQLLSNQSSEIDALKRKYANLEEQLTKGKESEERLVKNAKRQKEKINKLCSKVDKLHTALRKVKKQYQILRDDVESKFSLLKSKFSLQMTQMLDFFTQNKEQSERKNKSKMNDLLDEMEVKEKQLVQNLEQQKQELKAIISQKNELLERKEEEVSKFRARFSGSELQKKQIFTQLDKQKLHSSQLEQKLDRSEQRYEDTINKLQKDVSKSMGHFHSKWSDNLAKVQNQLDTKDGQLKMCLQQIDELSGEVAEEKKRKEWSQQEVKKLKKKHEKILSERDEQFNSQIKRYDHEVKHRVNLEKQLKSIKLSLMRGGTNPAVSNISFNDKQMFNPQVNQRHLTSNQDYYNQKEKEYSQIKDMIAKTIRFAEEEPSAQRDISKNVSKKHLFK